MPHQRLDNYLRTYRKRADLSQDDVAFLMGLKGGMSVCRYERYGREPSLDTILSYEAIFHVPASELFAGRFQAIQRDIAKRAALLAERLGLDTLPDPKSRKRQSFRAIRNSSSPFLQT